MRSGSPRAAQAALVIVLLLLGYYWWSHVGPPAEMVHDHPVEQGTGQSDVQNPDGGTDPTSGLELVRVSVLPPEAAETIDLIKSAGPFPYERDGVTFGNFEGILPERSRGYYREYTVPTPGSADRGARRIVVGSEGEYYWTSDHYRTFQRIENP